MTKVLSSLIYLCSNTSSPREYTHLSELGRKWMIYITQIIHSAASFPFLLVTANPFNLQVNFQGKGSVKYSTDMGGGRISSIFTSF